MGRGLVVLSLFDGISCGRIALDKLGIPVKVYYASEIEPNAIKVSTTNYPDIIQIGDVRNVKVSDLKEKVDLVLGGSPCQDISKAMSNREGLAGKKSGLFYEYVRILKEAQPKWFLFENNHGMSPEVKAEITNQLGVESILINSALVSPQARKRLYWTNIPVSQPEPIDIKLQDILEYGYADREKGLCLTCSYSGYRGSQAYLCRRYFKKSFGQAVFTSAEDRDFIKAKWEENDYFEDTELPHKMIRAMSCLEVERYQTLPDNYTACLPSEIARKRAVGNGWTVKVIMHLLSGICKDILK